MLFMSKHVLRSAWMVHSNRECIQAGTQVLLRVASGRCRVNELTHFLPSNRAESSPTAQTRPHRSWQGRGEGSPSTRLTEPELFDYKASFIYTPGKTAQGKQRRRQRSISRTAADTAGGGSPGERGSSPASRHHSHLCAPTAATRAKGIPAVPSRRRPSQQRPSW